MGWKEDEPKSHLRSSETTDSGATATERGPGTEGRDLPLSYPRQEGEHELEMQNLDRPRTNASQDLAMNRSRSPIDGLRRRLSRDPQVRKEREEEDEARRNQREVPVAVVEQRLSNLAQGCLCTSAYNQIHVSEADY
jgi:hypothetical protein